MPRREGSVARRWTDPERRYFTLSIRTSRFKSTETSSRPHHAVANDGSLEPDELNELYNSMMAILALSFTNASAAVVQVVTEEFELSPVSCGDVA
jgi:hypothetical protein